MTLNVSHVVLYSCFLFVSTSIQADCQKLDTDHIQCDYKRYSTVVSCEYNLPIFSQVTGLAEDQGRENTSSQRYYEDPQAAALGCQQTSNKPYNAIHPGYTVGQLTAIDHLDDDQSAALETNALTNIVPQASKFKKTGAWKRIEILTDCFRESETDAPLSVLSGVIFGTSLNEQPFEKTHTIQKIPDFFWRVIYLETSNKYDAWIMRNQDDSDIHSLRYARRTLPGLIRVLSQQNTDDVYSPAIEALKKLEINAPTNTTLTYHSTCRKHIG